MMRHAGVSLAYPLSTPTPLTDNIRDFLTGFHKRKLAKTEAARKKALEREKQS